MQNSEEPQKPYRQILEQEIKQALEELARPAKGLFTSGLLAGIGIGISPLLVSVLLTHIDGTRSELVIEILVANFYTIGFIFVILGHTDLFTEYTTIAILPILDGRASIKSLSRLWGLIYIGNLVGVAIFAGFATVIGPALGIVEPQIFGEIARDRVTHSWWVILFSGALAGWLMGLLSWLIAAGRDTISQIFFVWLIVLAIKFCHFHHSISGSVEVLAGILTSTLGITSLFYFLLWSTIGNAIGGIFFAMLVRNSLVMSSTKRSSNRRYDQHQQDSYKQRHRRR